MKNRGEKPYMGCTLFFFASTALPMYIIELPWAEVIYIWIEHRSVAPVVKLRHSRVPGRLHCLHFARSLRVRNPRLILRVEVVLLNKGLPVLIAIQPLRQRNKRKREKQGCNRRRGRGRRTRRETRKETEKKKMKRKPWEQEDGYGDEDKGKEKTSTRCKERSLWLLPYG